jgi:hypothetical protein
MIEDYLLRIRRLIHSPGRPTSVLVYLTKSQSRIGKTRALRGQIRPSLKGWTESNIPHGSRDAPRPTTFLMLFCLRSVVSQSLVRKPHRRWLNRTRCCRKAEEEAQNAKRGMWSQGSYMSPRDWRKAHHN